MDVAAVLASSRTVFRGSTLRALIIILAALLVTAVIDAGVLVLIQVGAPGHKNPELFYLELSILMSAAILLVTASIYATNFVRLAMPFFMIVLAWHTGFQIQLGSDKFVLTVFDVLVPVLLFLGISRGWHRSRPGITWFQRHWRLLVLWWAVCLYGLLLAIARDVALQPMIANLKSLLIYPLILIILPWCIDSWKQLYASVGLMLVLILERALDGLHQAQIHQVLRFQTLLANRELVYRIDGDMAATNQYATYLLTGALIFTALVAGSKLPKQSRIAMLIPLVLVGMALLLTLSRGAWLGTAVALLCLMFMLRPRRGLSALAIAAFVVVALQFLHPQTASEFFARAHQYDSGIRQRQLYENIGLAVVRQYPLGAGWGAWFTQTPTGVQPVSGYPWYHDDYLQLATEVGIPGLAVMLAILLSVLRTGVMASRGALNQTRVALVAGLTAALLGMLIQSATDQFLWHADIAPHIWIVAGLVASAGALLSAEKERRQRIDAAVAMAGKDPPRQLATSSGNG